MARSKVNELKQRLKDTVSREVLQLVIGYIEAASEELTDSMIYADETDKTLRLQGQVRGYRDIAHALSRVHD
ncbi:MAG: hypothetical protein IKY97_02955 [Mailhella sp.]|nr:hypothetical protein [Mailhella sp.]